MAWSGWGVAGSGWAQATVQTHTHSATSTTHLIQFRLASAIANSAAADPGRKNKSRRRVALVASPVRGRAHETRFSPSCKRLKEVCKRLYASFVRLKSNLHHKCVFFVGRQRQGGAERPLRGLVGDRMGRGGNWRAERFDTLKRRRHAFARASKHGPAIADPLCLSMKPKSA